MSSREVAKLVRHNYRLMVMVMFQEDECTQKNVRQSPVVEAEHEVSPVRRR